MRADTAIHFEGGLCTAQPAGFLEKFPSLWGTSWFPHGSDNKAEEHLSNLSSLWQA